MMTMMMATIEILLEVMLSLTVMLILMMMMMMMMMILLLLFLHHHPPVIMDPDDCPVAKAGGRVEVVLFLLCQSSGLKYNEAPECAGDVTGATPAGCDELGADGCDGKYTSVEGGVYSQCKVSGSNCLAVGPLCKKPESASMTCSSLSDCEGKGWKQTWTSGTTPDSWKSTHPYKLQHEGEIIEAIRATDGKTYERELVSDKSNYGGGGSAPAREEIDFPYVRGYGNGNSCGSSSLSYFNWNSGTNFCSKGFKAQNLAIILRQVVRASALPTEELCDVVRGLRPDPFMNPPSALNGTAARSAEMFASYDGPLQSLRDVESRTWTVGGFDQWGKPFMPGNWELLTMKADSPKPESESGNSNLSMAFHRN
ncbi:hypothetical protein AK812_SmicGene12408 [Symbiodinium microadriaticum]|uniref:Uncharacterized protein n=1 Tax=Symbiodinium microadriaticum TaxID=2951 RepID=A0A1Q9EAN8_SYMMI|nr:hypothetical protein AK812_SmicGene12408 [Symbiodinium microadriaticum]